MTHITIEREEAERILHVINSGAGELRQLGLRLAGKTLEQALAAPVQPAAWESEMRSELAKLGFEGQCPESIGITIKGWFDAYAKSLTAQPAPEQQEPCGWQFYQDGKWHNGMETSNHRANTEAAGIPVRDVYPSPHAAPVQEPVAWGVFEGGNLHDMFFTKEEADNMAHLKGLHAEIRPLTTPPAAPDLQAELDATNRQVEILSDALAESRREVAAPVQEPLAWLYREGLEALKAGKCWTAYGTKQDDNCNIPVHLNAAVAPKVEPVKAECDGFDSHSAAPVQEPFCFVYVENGEEYFAPKGAYVPDNAQPLYTTPPAQPAPVRPTKDVEISNMGKPFTVKAYVTPPAAQRKPVDLTNDEINNIANGWYLGKSVQGAIREALDKYKEKNT